MAVLAGRVGLIVNPASRTGARAEAHVLAVLAAAGITPTVERTRAAGDGVRAARDLAPAHDCILVLGGDGTLMEAATGLAELKADVPLGILPGGTGNQIARAISMPMSAARAAKRLIATGEVRAIDCGVLNGARRVGIGVGLGLDAAMIAGARGRLKQVLGVGSYVVSALSVAWRPHRFPVRATVDGRVFERECSVVLAVNLGYMFKGLMRAVPGSSLTDGRVDLAMLDTRHLYDFVHWSVTRAMLRLSGADPRWTFASGEHITIETSDLTVPAQVDGDLITPQPFELRVLPRALRLLVPKGVAII